MSQKINFIKALTDLRTLWSDIANLQYANMGKAYPVEQVKADFNIQDSARTMFVQLPWLNVTATAQARPVWGNGDWRMEYVFTAPYGQEVVEVFRVYLDHDLMASSVDGERWGTANGHDFIAYVCESVASGVLSSPHFAPKA
jgi:hypothetical protein